MGESTKIKKRNHPLPLAVIAGAVALGVLGQIVTACSSSEKPAASSAANAPTTTSPIPMTTPPSAPPVAAPAPVPPAAPPTDCTPASQDLVDQVDAQLAPSGQTLADTFMKVSPDGYIYVGGNIMEGETKNSSADVWVANDSGLVLYALSGSARDETPNLADGRNLGLSAGDEIGQAVQECSIAAYRDRQ